MEWIKKHRYLVLGITITSVLIISGVILILINIKPARIALAKLETTFQGTNICHEECYIFRQNQEKIIVAGFKKDAKILTKMILNYWQSPQVTLEFKTELVRLARMIYGTDNPPEFLKNYLIDTNSNLDLVEEIMTEFNINSTSLSGELINKLKSVSSTDEKIEILRTLSKIGNDSEIENYFSLLNSGEEIKVKREVIKNISNIHEKSNYFKLTQLANIKELIFTDSLEVNFRRELILLIGDYYLVFPKNSLDLWQEIYDSKTLDNISRLFAADNLNHLAKTELILPVVSSQEWEEYYNK